MKKISLIIIVLVIMFFLSNVKSEEVLIPKDAIRFRVIANSNSEKDQTEKKIIAKNLGENVTSLLKNTNSLDKSRLAIKNNINTFKSDIDDTIKENNINTEYSINYGINYFPEKTYKGIKYNAGDYESLVVTLGEGAGDNFWCVLFPPLCLLEGEETDKNDIEYKSFVKEVIDKYF